MVLNLFLPFVSLPARAAEASFSLSPVSGGNYIGQTFDVNILINTGGADTDAADVILHYDSHYLEVVDMISSVPGVQVKPGSVYGAYPGNQVDPATGTIRITAFSIFPYNSGGGSDIFATIRFRGKNTVSNTSVSFDFTPGESIDCNIAETGTSEDILASVADGASNVLPDNNPPYITGFSPVNGANNVSPSTNIRFNIRDDETAVNLDSLRINVAGTEYTRGGANKFTYTGSAKNYSITVNPAQNFSYSQIVNVSVNARDAYNNIMPAYNSLFTTAPKPENFPPELSPISDKTVFSGSTVSFVVSATDANSGDRLSLSMLGAPAGASLTPTAKGKALFSWDTTMAEIRDYPITFRVQDNGDPILSDEEQMVISITETALPPEPPAPECPPCPPCGERTECSDNIDNDGDGDIDFSADLQCSDYYDDSESEGGLAYFFGEVWNSVKNKVKNSRVGKFVLSNIFNLSANGDGYFALSPNSGSFYPGQVISINILEGTAFEDTNAADVVLYYDPDYLEVVDAIPGTPGVQVQPGSIYEVYPGNVVDSGDGVIRITGFSIVGTFNSGDGSGVFATVNFRAKQTTAATSLNFQFTPGSTTDSNILLQSTNEDILASAGSATFAIIPDAGPPYITDFLPPNESVNRARNSNISFRIKDDETGVNINSVQVLVDGVEYTATGANRFSYLGNSFNYLVTINPPNFDYSQRVDVYVDGKDTQNNTMSTYHSWFRVMDEPENHAPVLEFIPDQTAHITTLNSFVINASDSDSGDIISFELEGAPAGATVTKASNVKAVFNWIPGEDDIGTHYVTIKVSDNGSPKMSDDQIVAIEVSDLEEGEPSEPRPECAPCPVCAQCLDGRDNDGDGKIDYPFDPGCETEDDVDETDPEVMPACSDGADNDGDGLVDFPFDPGCESAADNDETDTEITECSDGVDNDNDGKIDFPNDPGCLNAADNNETDPLILPECSDGADNDNDGLVDFPNDPGCASAADDSETEAAVAICSDGIDNDGDGRTDYPFDPGCINELDDDETDPPIPPQCFDSSDNDGDGRIDFPNDPGCESAADDDEINITLPACADGRDNDGDGLVDFPNDPGCESAADNNEFDVVEEEDVPSCSDGRDNDRDGLIDYPVDPGCESPDDDSELDLEDIPALVNLFIDSTLDIARPIVEGAAEATREVIDNPRVERVSTDYVAPAAAIVAITNASTAISVVSLFPYLQFLFTEPLWLLARRKRYGWGVVYDAITKRPIDLAVVRLFNQDTGAQVQTRVTDKLGRYYFIVKKEGNYRIAVTKPEYKFPSETMKGERSDIKYTEVYHGETIEVSQSGAVITASIPLDPEKEVVPDKKVIAGRLAKKLQHAVSLSGLVISFITVVIAPRLLIILLFLLHVAIYILFRRLAYPKKPKNWGIVYDKKTKEPLEKTVVRIFDNKFNKLLDTQVTSSRGRYGFLVGPNVYYLTADRPGYEKQKTEPLDFHKVEEGTFLTKNIPLPRKEGKKRTTWNKDSRISKGAYKWGGRQTSEGYRRKAVRAGY